MSIKRKLICFFVIFTAALFTGANIAQAAGETIFTVSAELRAGGKYTVRVSTNQREDAGGLHLRLIFDPEHWELPKSVKTAAKGADTSVLPESGTVSFVWDTAGTAALPEILLEAKVLRTGETGDNLHIQLEVVEYYDNTADLNDIPYTVRILPPEESPAKAGSGWRTALLIGAGIIAAATAGLFLYRRKISRGR